MKTRIFLVTVHWGDNDISYHLVARDDLTARGKGIAMAIKDKYIAKASDVTFCEVLLSAEADA